MRFHRTACFVLAAFLVSFCAPLVVRASISVSSKVNFPAEGGVLKTGSLLSISCIDVTKCVAVGNFKSDIDTLVYPVVVRIDGSSVTATRGSNASGLGLPIVQNGIASVDCVSDGVCWAIGNDSLVNSKSYLAKITANSWETSFVAMGNGVTKSDLRSISCWTSTLCAVAGYLNTSGGDTRPAVGFTDNGSSVLSIIDLPGGALAFGKVLDVSCISSGVCLAVGHFFSGQEVKYFTSSFNGVGWTSRLLEMPFDSLPQATIDMSQYEARVSCTEFSGCLIAGKYRGAFGSYYGFFGVSPSPLDNFSIQRLAQLDAGPTNPSAGSSFLIASVNCVGSMSCVVAGDLARGGGQSGFAFRYKDAEFSNVAAGANFSSSTIGKILVDCLEETKCVGVIADRYFSGGENGLGSLFGLDLRTVTQPVVTQPVVTQPVVTQPVVTQPVVTQPVVTQPVADPVNTPPIVPNSTSVTPPRVTLSKAVSLKSIATFAKLKVLSSSRVRLKVVSSSSKFCKVSGATLRGLKTGSCKVTVTVTPKKGRPTSKTVTLKVAK
jgi:hypothetical protein